MENLSPQASSRVVALYIGPEAGKPLNAVGQVVTVAGHGLEGDRKYRDPSTRNPKDGPDREVTLIEIEAIEAVKRDYGFELSPAEARRNVVTQGLALNHLVGRTFRVGQALLRGLRLCEPCTHLESLTRKGIRKALIHRGGLRAQVVESGVIRVGDPVTPI